MLKSLIKYIIIISLSFFIFFITKKEQQRKKFKIIEYICKINRIPIKNKIGIIYFSPNCGLCEVSLKSIRDIDNFIYITSEDSINTLTFLQDIYNNTPQNLIFDRDYLIKDLINAKSYPTIYKISGDKIYRTNTFDNFITQQ